MINEYVTLIVNKPSVAYAAKTGGGTIANIYEINLLASGAIAIFTEENILVTAATSAASLVGVQQFWIAMGSVDGKAAIKTPPIDRDAFHQLKTAYVAPVKQVSFIGEDSGGTGALNLPAALTTDMVATVKIVETTGVFQAGGKLSYEVRVTSGETNATLVTKIINAINNNPSSVVVAAVVGASVGISLTAKEFGVQFEVLVSGILENADIEKAGAGASVVMVTGQGTLAQLQQIEDEADITTRSKSNSAGQQQLWWKQPSELDATGATTFVTYNLKWKSELNVGLHVKNVSINHVIVGMSSEDTTFITAWDVLLAIIMQAPETGGGSSPEGEFSD